MSRCTEDRDKNGVRENAYFGIFLHSGAFALNVFTNLLVKFQVCKSLNAQELIGMSRLTFSYLLDKINQRG